MKLLITKLNHKLNTFLKLSFLEKSLVIQGLILLPLIHFYLQLKGLKKTQVLLTKLVPKFKQINNNNHNNLSQIFRIAKTIKIISKYYPFATCLRQSLLLWYLLKKEGIESKLCIGVRKEKKQLLAHAWVEYQGFAINETNNINQIFVNLIT